MKKPRYMKNDVVEILNIDDVFRLNLKNIKDGIGMRVIIDRVVDSNNGRGDFFYTIQGFDYLFLREHQIILYKRPLKNILKQIL